MSKSVGTPTDEQASRGYSSARAFCVGALAAVRAPRLVRGGAFAALLSAAHAGPSARRMRGVGSRWDHEAQAARHRSAAAVRVAFLLLARLARIPGGRWRNTCLFRAVVECRILRAEGFAAVVRVGVKSVTHPLASIAAHAWVECDGVACVTAEGDARVNYAPLYGARCPQ